jgi:hypothetical protein
VLFIKIHSSMSAITLGEVATAPVVA